MTRPSFLLQQGHRFLRLKVVAEVTDVGDEKSATMMVLGGITTWSILYSSATYTYRRLSHQFYAYTVYGYELPFLSGGTYALLVSVAPPPCVRPRKNTAN